MSPTRTLRLGTRRSALAWIQSSQVAAALRAAHPGLVIEMVGIETRGDRIQDVPLTGIEGKEFFTAEIDAALAEGRVDFTVHSLKDLSLDRPKAFVLGAIPKRANPRDIAIFAPDVPERLAAGLGVRIGTGSPRRVELLPEFLGGALPHGMRNRIELVGLRGNVDSRLRRVREPRGSERHLDGVVLAFAGLSRLFADTETERQGRKLMGELLAGLPLMVLPLTDNPAAPGQGALAIECRADDDYTRQVLSAIEDPPTRAAIAAERAVLARHGGGCHQAFGATWTAIDGLGGVLQIAGKDSAGRNIDGREWFSPTVLEPPAAGSRGWDGTDVESAAAVALPDAAARIGMLRDAVFVAHSRALPSGAAAHLAGRRVWTSGTPSWFRLAAAGVWVEGCAEGRGAAVAASLVSEPLLRLPPPSAWSILTHDAAGPGWSKTAWSGADIVPTYHSGEDGLGEAAGLRDATHVYWSSVSQFERGRGLVRADAHHACGPGKTADHLRAAGVRDFQAFPSAQEWRAWMARAR
jgi:hydroxymethylbilane synthase